MMEILKKKRLQDRVNLVLAACLFVSPWLFQFADYNKAAWNAWISAAIIAGMAIAALLAFAEWEEWIEGMLGIWVVAAPWSLGFSMDRNALLPHVVLGTLVIVMAGWEVWQIRHGRATAGSTDSPYQLPS